jgi:hypothetical protein
MSGRGRARAPARSYVTDTTSPPRRAHSTHATSCRTTTKVLLPRTRYVSRQLVSFLVRSTFPRSDTPPDRYPIIRREYPRQSGHLSRCRRQPVHFDGQSIRAGQHSLMAQPRSVNCGDAAIRSCRTKCVRSLDGRTLLAIRPRSALLRRGEGPGSVRIRSVGRCSVRVSCEA